MDRRYGAILTWAFKILRMVPDLVRIRVNDLFAAIDHIPNRGFGTRFDVVGEKRRPHLRQNRFGETIGSENENAAVPNQLLHKECTRVSC